MTGRLTSARFRARRWLTARLGRDRVLDSAVLQRLLAFSRDGTTIVDRAGEPVIEYQPSSDIGSRIFLSGGFEKREVAFARSLIETEKRSPIVLDVGANVGVHTIAWARVRADVQVYAFEPSPQTSAILERNLGRSGVEHRVAIMRAAVSNVPGIATFHECSDDAYSSLKDTGRKHVVRTVAVETITLDDFVRRERLTHVTLLKIDVEGTETDVVAGAAETLRSLGPDILIEIYAGNSSNPDPDRTIALLCEHGYHAYVFADGGLRPFEQHDDRFYNYYFTKRAKVPPR